MPNPKIEHLAIYFKNYFLDGAPFLGAAAGAGAAAAGIAAEGTAAAGAAVASSCFNTLVSTTDAMGIRGEFKIS